MHFSVFPVDFSLAQMLQDKIDNKTKPVGSLGRLEEIAVRIGCIQNSLSPRLCDPHMLIFAGDHGAARAGISAYPQDVSWQMLENYLKGGAAANVFSRLNGMAMLVIDAGVAHDFGPRDGLIDAKIDPAGTRNYLEEPAMTPAQCTAAIAKGAEIARAVADRGCNIMGVGEKGIGNTGSASLITHLLTGVSLDDCVGRGTGLNDVSLANKKRLMKQAIQRAHLPADADVMMILREFGGFEIAMMTGALLAGAERGMVLLADGFIATSALLVAHRIAPAVCDYCIFSHCSAEAGHRAQIQFLGGKPLLDIGMRLGEGTGAMVAFPIVRAAVAFLNEMASFASAGVSKHIR